MGMFFKIKPPNFDDLVPQDLLDLEDSEINTDICEYLTTPFQHTMEARNKYLQILHAVEPWINLDQKTRSKIFSNILMPMMYDKKTSQYQHSLVAYHITSSFFYRESSMIELVAKEIHVMLEESKSEVWFYLDKLGYHSDNKTIRCQFFPMLQHLGTPLLLLEMLEQCKFPKNQVELNILLRIFYHFAEHGVLSQWDELKFDRLLQCLGSLILCLHALILTTLPLPAWSCTMTRCIARILAALDSRELKKLSFLPAILKRILTVKDLEHYGPLLYKLASSPEFLPKVASPHLLNIIIMRWKEREKCPWLQLQLQSFDFNDEIYWSLTADMADWAAEFSPNQFFELISVLQRNKLIRNYPKLKLKVEHILMNPANIRYCQDSISFRFQDGKCVSSTKNKISSRNLSPHRIPPIKVFLNNDIVYAEDNRRLYAFKEAGIKHIPVQLTTVPVSKFTTKNDGLSIRVRY